MYPSNSELQLRQARAIADPQGAIDAYMRAIEKAVRELKDVRPALRLVRRR